MLREGGQDALDRGDKPAAESSWRGMLKVVMAPPAGSKASAPTTATAPPGPAGNAPTPARGLASAGPAGPSAAPVVTLERFEQVAQLAKLAAEHDLIRVSTEALRDALAAGPPVTPMAIPGGNARIIRRAGNDPQVDAVAQKVEEYGSSLDAIWSIRKADPALVYEAYPRGGPAQEPAE